MTSFFIPNEKNGYQAHLLKKPFLTLIVIIVLCFNVFVSTDIQATSSDEAISVTNLLKYHNAKRREVNIGELSLNKLLSLSAQNKADQMLANDCWSHFCPNGKSPWDFFDAAEYDYIFAGENLAEGFTTIDDVVQAWMNSKTHRENIEKAEYTEVGFGLATGTYQGRPDNLIVVVHFGTRSANVMLNENQELVITNPRSGETYTTDLIDLIGTANEGSEVNIFTNGEYEGNARINEGQFTYKLSSFIEGKNRVYVQDAVSGGYSNTIDFTYRPSFLGISTQSSTNGSFVDVSIPGSTKNIINLSFAGGLALLFLIDFIVLSRTNVLQRTRSYSHYHFVLLIVVALIIVSGGFSGNIGEGVFR